MLQLTGVSYRYAGYAYEVLHDVDLRLDDGEIVGLVGPNEAGKSTLCLVASGLAPASIGGSVRGTVAIDGTPTTGLPTHRLAEHVVVAFQNPNTQRSGIAATVFEEIALGPMNLGLPVADTVARTHEAMARLRGVLPLVGPVILSSLTEVEERSLALEVRAFGKPGRRQLLWRMPDTTAQLLARVLLLAALLVAVLLRLTGSFPAIP